MAEIDQRPGTDRRRADGRSGIHTGFSLGRTALTGWALTAILGLAGFGTALGATPVPVADTTPLGGFGTVVQGSASAVDPRAVLTVGQVVNPVAVAVAAVPILPMDTVTAVSAPTPAADVPTGTVAAPGAGTPDLAVGGTPPATATTVPAGPAAQLRQAAFTAAAPDQRAGLAIRTALAQIGLPYVWGGDGPTNGDAGFDCSGLTTFSYGTAGVLLPRTAHTQYNTGPHIPDGAALQPGDLVFYGTSARVHHVGMYLGAGRMVNAPTFGKPVQVAFYRYRGDDYLGATRPAAAGGSLTTGVLPYVDPLPAVPDVALAPAQRQQQAQERIFQAPTASLPAVLPQPGDAAPPEQQSAAQSIAESDAVAPARVVAPQPVAAPVAAPVAVEAPAQPGRGSDPVAGTTTASSAPITTSPTAPAAVTTSPSTSAPAPSIPASAGPAPSSPAGSTTSGTTTTAAPPVASSTQVPVTQVPAAQVPATQVPATQVPETSSPTPVVVEKASGSTTATTTLAPTSSVRTTTPKATTSKVAKPVAPKTTATTTAVKTVTSPTTTAKAATTTSKPAAKTEDDDPTTTKTSASKTKASKTKTAEETADEKSSEKTSEKTTEKKTTEKKTTEEKSSDESDD